MPALPLDEAGKYVAGAYVVFVTLILIYVSIMAAKLSRIESQLIELNELADAETGAPVDSTTAPHGDPLAEEVAST